MTKRNTELYSMQSPSIPLLKRQKPRALAPALFPMAMRRVLSEPSALFRVSSASGMPRPPPPTLPAMPLPPARTHAQAPGPTQPTTMSHQKQPLHSSIGADATRWRSAAEAASPIWWWWCWSAERRRHLPQLSQSRCGWHFRSLAPLHRIMNKTVSTAAGMNVQRAGQEHEGAISLATRCGVAALGRWRSGVA